MDCVEKLIRKNGMVCPISGKILKESDIIMIARVSIISTPVLLKTGTPDPASCSQNTRCFFFFQGGTGFAGAGVELKASKAGAVMMV